MTWNATQELDYTRQDVKTLAHFRHKGPLGMALLRQVWLAWRSHFWQLACSPSTSPRIWAT